MLVQVVYISSATKAFEPSELDRLLEGARRRNERSGVTGVLLHDDYSFLQVLEGTPEAVRRTVERIKRDPRHGGMTVVQDQPITERDFSDWSMAYDRRDITELDRMRGARKLEPGLLRSIAASLSQPVSRTFVQCFGERGRPTSATASSGPGRSAPTSRST